MQHTFLSGLSPLSISLVLFIGMILIYFIANQLAKRPIFSKYVDDTINPIEGSLLGLLALLLAFTFGMSASRYETRRAVMLSEANNIGTVILRCDLYPDSTRTVLKNYLKPYVEARIDYFQSGSDEAKEKKAIAETEKWDNLIWSEVAKASKVKDNLVASNQMIPALNAMIDIVTNRNAEKNAIPDVKTAVSTTKFKGYSFDYSKTDFKRRLFLQGSCPISKLLIFSENAAPCSSICTA
jgi:hypothetical protein